MHMINRDAILHALKLNSKKVSWGTNTIHIIQNREDQKLSEELIKHHRANIVGVILVKFKSCKISPDEHFLKPLAQKKALKENRLNLAVVTEIAFEYVYLHLKKSNGLFESKKWTLHLNKRKAAEELSAIYALTGYMESDAAVRYRKIK
jgi:hypothetical protein